MKDNPIFQDGDLVWDGVIIRKVPEISTFVTNTGRLLVRASVSGRVEPVFLCGQQAATVAFGQMAKPTFRKEDDYGFITGTGIEMAYGMAKMFKKHAMYIPGTGNTTLNSSASGNTSGGLRVPRRSRRRSAHAGSADRAGRRQRVCHAHRLGG
jgi:hypothetical protein